MGLHGIGIKPVIRHEVVNRFHLADVLLIIVGFPLGDSFRRNPVQGRGQVLVHNQVAAVGRKDHDTNPGETGLIIARLQAPALRPTISVPLYPPFLNRSFTIKAAPTTCLQTFTIPQPCALVIPLTIGNSNVFFTAIFKRLRIDAPYREAIRGRKVPMPRSGRLQR